MFTMAHWKLGTQRRIDFMRCSRDVGLTLFTVKANDPGQSHVGRHFPLSYTVSQRQRKSPNGREACARHAATDISRQCI